MMLNGYDIEKDDRFDKSKKIKIFLGGYINSTNAQNLNCLALAKYLDKEKFKVYTLTSYWGDLKYNPIKGVKVFSSFYPARISQYLCYLWGIWKCDIAYLPKGELDKWNKFWLKFLRKKSFKTLEGIADQDNLKSIIIHWGSYEQYLESFTYFDKVFSISKFINEYNYEHHNIKTESLPLYLGVEFDRFKNTKKKIMELGNIIFIGRLLKRKGIYDFLNLAKLFPNVNFHIVGHGNELQNIQNIIKEENIINTKLYGVLNHKELSALLLKMDLHILPSHSEGFPKVILETASTGVASLVYSDYGANEWIKDHKDGFVVDTFEQMQITINELLNDPILLQNVSKNAIDMAKRFDWKILVKDWENNIVGIYHENK